MNFSDVNGGQNGDPLLDARASGDDVQSPPLTIAFFGHDWTESTIRKRIGAFLQRNTRVTGFMFRRRHDKPVSAPSWNNVELGLTDDGRYGRRLLRLLNAFPVVWRNRAQLRAADVIYARNIDMLFVALVSKRLVRADAPLVYEALDVHPAFTQPGIVGRALRFAERRLLSSIALMVVSSPTFMDRYFRPLQRYAGPWFLLENKVSSLPQGVAMPRKANPPPWIVGWFGVLRCRRSLDILQKLAARRPHGVTIHIRGLPSETDGITKDLLDEVSARTKNIRYFGVYQNPEDLAKIYGAVDLTWAVDFSASGANSDWLIPNRLYEGGLHGIPAIARKDTATGDIVENDTRGWSLAEPFEESLDAFLDKLDAETYSTMAARLHAKDRSAFVDISDTARLLTELSRVAFPA
jgi:succinoglycan biosynthesis protein ExoL